MKIRMGSKNVLYNLIISSEIFIFKCHSFLMLLPSVKNFINLLNFKISIIFLLSCIVNDFHNCFNMQPDSPLFFSLVEHIWEILSTHIII